MVSLPNHRSLPLTTPSFPSRVPTLRDLPLRAQRGNIVAGAKRRSPIEIATSPLLAMTNWVRMSDTRPLPNRTSVPYTIPHAYGSKPEATAQLPKSQLNIGFTGVQVTRSSAATVHCGTSDFLHRWLSLTGRFIPRYRIDQYGGCHHRCARVVQTKRTVSTRELRTAIRKNALWP